MSQELSDLIFMREIESRPKPYARPADPTFLPIRLTGGVGDIIMDGETVEILRKKYQVVVYTGYQDAYKYFYPHHVPLLEPEPRLTWHLRINAVARFHFEPEFSGFAIPEHRELFQNQLSLFERDLELKERVKNHPNQDFLLAGYAAERNLNRRSLPLHSLGFTQDASIKLGGTRASPGNYITIHDGCEVAFSGDVSEGSTKQWPMIHWQEMIARLKSSFPKTKIVQLGAKTSRPISGVHECLINKTTLPEAFDILSKSKLHIDGDSGLVHVASKMNVPCIVLWGPTPDSFYAYGANTNIRSTESCPGSCYWVKKNWMEKCPIEHHRAPCMNDISPDKVMIAASKALHHFGAQDQL